MTAVNSGHNPAVDGQVRSSWNGERSNGVAGNAGRTSIAESSSSREQRLTASSSPLDGRWRGYASRLCRHGPGLRSLLVQRENPFSHLLQLCIRQIRMRRHGYRSPVAGAPSLGLRDQFMDRTRLPLITLGDGIIGRTYHFFADRMASDAVIGLRQGFPCL